CGLLPPVSRDGGSCTAAYCPCGERGRRTVVGRVGGHGATGSPRPGAVAGTSGGVPRPRRGRRTPRGASTAAVERELCARERRALHRLRRWHVARRSFRLRTGVPVLRREH